MHARKKEFFLSFGRCPAKRRRREDKARKASSPLASCQFLRVVVSRIVRLRIAKMDPGSPSSLVSSVLQATEDVPNDPG